MPTDGSDTPRGGGTAAVLDDDAQASADAARALEKKLEAIGKAAVITVAMAVRASLARGGEGLSNEQREELGQVRSKLATSLDALDEQSRRGGLGEVDLAPLREKIVRAIRDLDEHLLPDHPGQESGAHEVLPS